MGRPWGLELCENQGLIFVTKSHKVASWTRACDRHETCPSSQNGGGEWKAEHVGRPVAWVLLSDPRPELHSWPCPSLGLDASVGCGVNPSMVTKPIKWRKMTSVARRGGDAARGMGFRSHGFQSSCWTLTLSQPNKACVYPDGEWQGPIGTQLPPRKERVAPPFALLACPSRAIRGPPVCWLFSRAGLGTHLGAINPPSLPFLRPQREITLHLITFSSGVFTSTGKKMKIYRSGFPGCFYGSSYWRFTSNFQPSISTV